MGTTQMKVPCGNVPLFYNIALCGIENVVQGTWGTSYGEFFSSWGTKNNSSAANDEFSQTIWLPGGTYTITVTFLSYGSTGMMYFYIDGVEMGHVQTWLNTGTQTRNYYTVTGKVIGDGKHTISFKATEASYKIWIYDVSFMPTSLTSGSMTTFCEEGFVSPITVIPFWTNKTTVIQGTYSTSLNYYFVHDINPIGAVAADQDELSINLALAKGTYDVRGMGITASNRGIVKGYLDGDLAFTKDMYSSGVVYEMADWGTSVAVDETKVFDLRVKVDGKNASSSGYLPGYGSLLFKRVA